MKAILLVLILGAVSAHAKAKVTEVVLKKDLILDRQDQDYPGTASFCFDLKADQEVAPELCDTMDESARLCNVFVYNLEGSAPVSTVRAGTVFKVTQQIGPATSRDWSKETTRFKIFSNLTGSEETSNPNLIVQCYHTKKGLGPSKLSVREVRQAVQSVVELK